MIVRASFLPIVIALFALVAFPRTIEAQLGDWVVAQQAIDRTQGGFVGPLAVGDTFGISMAALGDLDGDGHPELAVGAQSDDGSGLDRGAIWILSLDAAGLVLAETKIGDSVGGFGGALSDGDLFGHALAALGDVDGDGVGDLAASSVFDDEGGLDRGAIWILFLNADGSVKGEQKIGSMSGGFGGALDDGDEFGIELEGPGDLDGDGVPDLLVGAWNDDDGGADRGALWILNLRNDGTVKAHQKISQTQGGFGGTLADGDQFGAGIAMLDDVDGNGTADLAVGSHSSDEAGDHSGSLWILFLASDESVLGQRKISALDGGFGGTLESFDLFGLNLGLLDDLDGDGTRELGVSAVLDDTGGRDRGALWVLSLNPDGSVKDEERIAHNQGGFTGGLRNDDHFGRPEPIGDLNGDGTIDLAVGATGADGRRGALWILLTSRCVSSAAIMRNGIGINPTILSCAAGPRVGATWDLSIDASAHLPGCVFLLGTTQPASGPVLRVGEVLVLPSAPHIVFRVAPHSGATVTIPIAIPADMALCGEPGFFQAFVTGGASQLTNALDVVVGGP